MTPDSQTRSIQAFLSIIITLGFFAIIGILIFHGAVDAGVKDILLVLLGALLASWKEVTGYFFGSSSSSAAKDVTIATQATTAATVAPLVAAAPLPVEVVTQPGKPIPVVESKAAAVPAAVAAQTTSTK